MSIIADTLKRLQTQSEGTSPESMDAPSSRPAFNKGEGSGRHRKDSPFGFLMVMVGMTLTLGGLAFAAFWMGGHLDFGLATDTQARMTNSRSVSTLPFPSDVQITTPRPSEAVMATEHEIVQPPPTSTPRTNEENISLPSIGTADSSPTQHASTQDTSSTRRPAISLATTASTEPPALSKSQDQHANSASEPGTDKDRGQIIPRESSSEEPPALGKSVHEPIPEIEAQRIVSIDVEEAEEPHTTNPVPVTLEEEIVHTEALVKTDKPSTNPTHTPVNLAARKAPPLEPNTTEVPPQPSPAHRLRQAQGLIQTGNYEEAVALLSPLFHDPPVKWQPWFWMGTALLGKGDMEQADQFLLSGLARNDKIPQLWIQRALVAQQRGDYQLAIHELRQAESLEADLPHIHLNMGYAYEQLGNDRLANQYYGKFMKLAEGNPAFFSTRKKLFARLTQQIHAAKPLPPLPSSIPEP